MFDPYFNPDDYTYREADEATERERYREEDHYEDIYDEADTDVDDPEYVYDPVAENGWGEL